MDKPSENQGFLAILYYNFFTEGKKWNFVTKKSQKKYVFCLREFLPNISLTSLGPVSMLIWRGDIKGI